MQQQLQGLQAVQQLQAVQIAAMQILNAANVHAGQCPEDGDPTGAFALFASAASSAAQAVQLTMCRNLPEAAAAVQAAQMAFQVASRAAQEGPRRGRGRRPAKRPRPQGPDAPVRAAKGAPTDGDHPPLWRVPGGNPWTREPEPAGPTADVPRGAKPVQCFRKPMAPRLPVGAQRFTFPAAAPTVPRFAALSPTLEHLPAAAPKLFPGAWTPDGTSRYAGVRRGTAGSDGKATWWACVERLGACRWLGPFRSETAAARAADVAMLLSTGPHAVTNFAYDTDELFADASLADAEGALGQLHERYYAQAYRVARKYQAEDVDAELTARRELEAAGRFEGEDAVAELGGSLARPDVPGMDTADDEADALAGSAGESGSGSSRRPRRRAAMAGAREAVAALAPSSPSVSGRGRGRNTATIFGAPSSSRKKFTSPYRGVDMGAPGVRARWRARIDHDGRRILLGTFATARAAAMAYDRRAVELRGASARPNFDADERSQLEDAGWGQDPSGWDVFDDTLASAAEASGWPVEEVLGGTLAQLGEAAAAAAAAKRQAARGCAAASTSATTTSAHGDDDTAEWRGPPSSSRRSRGAGKDDGRAARGPGRPAGLEEAAAISAVAASGQEGFSPADTPSDAAARMRQVRAAASDGDALAQGLLRSMDGKGAQASGDAGHPEAELGSSVKAVVAHGGGAGVSVVAGADPTAVTLQLAADSQADALVPVGGNGAGVFDGHVIRM